MLHVPYENKDEFMHLIWSVELCIWAYILSATTFSMLTWWFQSLLGFISEHVKV